MKDQRSGKIVVASHCILDVHCLEDDLAIYPGLEEDVVQLLIGKGVGIYQIPCSEIELSGIFRKALPKESYEHPKIRDVYHQLAEKMANTLSSYVEKGYEIVAVLGAEGSPTCGIVRVGKWKDDVKGKKEFPRDIEFISGMGVFMEEFQSSLDERNIYPVWIGIPGKSIRSIEPESLNATLDEIDSLLHR
jgi:predicted secreted protein